MAARLGNVIYWICCGVTALVLVATVDVLRSGVTDVRGPFATQRRWEVIAPTSRIVYIVSAPASMTKEEVLQDINFLAASTSLHDPTNAQLEEWLASHSAVGFRTDWWQEPVFLGLIPALLVWLFGRACRYVLAG